MAKTIKVSDSAIEWLARLKSPEVDDSELKSFFIWLEASPENQLAYIKAEQLWNQGAQLNFNTKEKPDYFLAPKYWIGGAAISICFVIYFAFTSLYNNKLNTYYYSTEIGKQQDVVLEDGTSLTLNTHSEIEVRYLEKKRIALLKQGEIFFEVAPNNERPFYVLTNHGSVRVYGTSFSVRNTDNEMLVTVTEGKVGVSQQSELSIEFQNSAILTRNQQISSIDASAGITTTTINASEITAWRQKKLIFQEKPLDEVIKEMNRYSSRRIELSNNSLSAIHVTAVVKLEDLDNAIKTLAQSLGLSLKINQETGTYTILQSI